MKSYIAIILGEPNSISSEIIFKAWKDKKKFKHKPFFIIGNKDLLEKQKKELRFSFKIKKISKNFTHKDLLGSELPVYDIKYHQTKPFQKISNKSSKFIFSCFNVCLDFLKEKKIQGFINCPISKENLFKKNYQGITEYIAKKINTAVFPGYQGGPLMHIIAAKAAGFLEALRPDFKDYIKSVLANAKILSETLKNNGFKIYSGGTDTHLMLVDLRPFKVKGNLAAESLSRANITCNKNGIPFDSESPMITSGIRLGSQAATTRGFGLKEFEIVGKLITKVIDGLSKNPNDNSKVEDEVRKEVVSLCSSFPIYKNLRK